MKKSIVVVLFSIFIMNIPAQEMQLSGGTEFGFGTFKVNNDVAFYDNTPIGGGLYQAHFINENTKSKFFAPGIGFSVRVFSDKDPLSLGFVFRDRASFVTNSKITGTGTIDGGVVGISETYSVADDNSFTTIMDFDLGASNRYILSKRWQFYVDLGLNFTMMDFEDYDTNETLSYWGAGIFSTLAMQVNLTSRMYLEFGINSIINVLSSQKGADYIEGIVIKYEDTGRWDFTTMAAYIHIGWRFDVEKLRNQIYGKKTAVRDPILPVPDQPPTEPER